MKLTFIDIKDIPKRQGYKNTKILKLLNEFAHSEMTAARVDDHEYKNAVVAAHALNQSEKRFNMTGIKAITRNGIIYLIKEI